MAMTVRIHSHPPNVAMRPSPKEYRDMPPCTEVFSFDGAIPKDGYEKSKNIHDEQAGDEGAIVRVDLLFHMLPAGEKDEEVDALEQSDEDGESGCVS